MSAANDAPTSRPVDRDVEEQYISLNAYETDNALVVVAPMPGVMPDDVEITLEGDCLELRAELRSDAPKDYLIHEWDYGAYRRAERIAEGYGEPITATLGKGQLVVSLTRGGERSSDVVRIEPTGKP